MTEHVEFLFSEISASKIYDEVMVPRLFIPWAHKLIIQAEIKSGDKVLDIACGPGTVTRLAAEKVGSSGLVVGVDFSSPMLTLASEKPALENAVPIQYVESNAAPLVLPDNFKDLKFDAITCQQGVQFFADKVAALKEMKQRIKPGGRVVFSLWSSLENCKIYKVLRDRLKEHHSEEAAKIMEAPFSFHNKKQIESLLHDASYENAEIEYNSIPLTYEKGVDQVISILNGSPLAKMISEMNSEARNKMEKDIEKGLKPLINEHGAVVCTMAAHTVIARF